MTSRSPPWDTEAPKWGAGLSQAPLCWGQEMNLQQVCRGWWSWKEKAGSWLHKCLTCTWVAQIQTKRLLSSCVSNPSSIYGQFPFHTSQSHISPDFCWDFAPPAHRTSQEQLMAVIFLAAQPFSHCLENFWHHSQLVCPCHSSLPSPVLFLPCSGNCILCIFFPIVTNLLPAAEFSSCFFPHTINSTTLFQLSVALCL